MFSWKCLAFCVGVEFVAGPLPLPVPPQAPPIAAEPQKAPCVCGDACRCKPGECPAKCPVAPPKGYPPAPAGFHWQRYPSGVWGLVQDGLAAPKAAPVRPAPLPRDCGPTG